MSIIDEHGLPWHPGESAVHALLRVPSSQNPTSRGLPRRYAYRAALCPLVALGALDAQGRPWCTVWGGERLMRPIAPDVLGIAGRGLDARYDPVLRGLFLHAQREEADGSLVVKPAAGEEEEDEQGRREVVMAGLGIDLDSRDRVKLAGRLVAGAVTPTQGEELADVQLAMLVRESLGNCPKYLNKRSIRPHVPQPTLVSDALPLCAEAVGLLAKADMFFMSSTDARGETMDTNNRGGAPGLVRVVRNEGGQVTLVYPEFSGNRLYQTLGNLHVKPAVGMVVPDFETGDVLYLTGETTILVGEKAAAHLPHAKLAVKIDVIAARFVKDGLPFRGGEVDFSPYNPPVWKLASEGGDALSKGDKAPATAILAKKEVLTPTITRFTFKLDLTRPGSLQAWQPGQHVTLDFSEELDMGWSHMRDDDPQSLNDDYIRTFTVSSPPLASSATGAVVQDGTSFEITVKKHGPVTAWLWMRSTRAGLEVPVLGFGGEEAFRIPIDVGAASSSVEHVFIAGGVGITPLLAQAPGVLKVASDTRRLRLIWALNADDLPLAIDTFKRIPGLAAVTELFISGHVDEHSGRFEGTGSRKVEPRRLTRRDVLSESAQNGNQVRRKYYLCAGTRLLKELMQWLDGEDVCLESFAY